jgi:cobalt/nickel transport system ATP-binding protein
MTDKATSDLGDRYNAPIANQNISNINPMTDPDHVDGGQVEIEQPESKLVASQDRNPTINAINANISAEIGKDPAEPNNADRNLEARAGTNLSQLSQPSKQFPEQKLDQNPVLTIADLCFSYADRPNVLQGINLQVSAGEKIGLIGPNGAGKTTLFLIICGVLCATQGKVDLFSAAIETGKFRPEIGLVFQNPNDQLFSASVWDDVAFGPINMGLPTEEVERRVQSALDITGVAELAQRPPHHLSGGEKRMVAIASVLACGPQLIIYDEPSANLDIRSRRRLIQFLQAATETRLVCSHDLELILEVCDRVILLDEGKIMADGSATKIMGDRQLMIAHGLERPHSLDHLNPDGHSH